MPRVLGLCAIAAIYSFLLFDWQSAADSQVAVMIAGFVWIAIMTLGFGVAFSYGLTGFACAWYYRRELRRDVKTFLYAGVLPVLGGIMLFACSPRRSSTTASRRTPTRRSWASARRC